MKNKEIKNRYKKIVEENTPNVLSEILEKCEGKKRESEVFEMKSEKKNNKFGFLKIAIPVAATCMVGVFGIMLASNQSKITNESIVALDVNPSIEMRINKKGDVVDTKSLNEDGKKILANIETNDVKVAKAIDNVVDSMVKNGYINETKNSILVSVKNKVDKIAQNLKDEVTKEIDKSLKNKSIEGAILSQNLDKEDKETIELANKHNLSVGKTKLILDILDEGLRNNNNELVTFEQLKDLTIDELNTIATTKKIKLKDISSTGTASKKEYIGEEKAKQIAFAHANVNGSDAKLVKANLDFEEGKFIYEVSFIVGNMEYEYEIDAKTGAITESEKELADKKDLQEIKYEENKENLSPEVKNRIEELKRQKAEIDRKDDELDKKEKELDAKKKVLENEKDQIERKIEQLEKEVRSLENLKDNEEDEAKIEELEKKIEELEKKVTEKENEIKAVEAKIEPLKQQLDELDRKEDKLEQEERKIKEELNRLMGNIK